MSTPQTPLVLTIQSHVAYGHVGNDAAMLPLQMLGIQPVAVHTVQFSNHTGYGEFKGQVFTPAHIADVLDGLRARGVLSRCVAVLSGYLGDAGVGEEILSAVQEVRAAHYEFELLCGGEPLTTVDAAIKAARAMLTHMHDTKSALIVITSLRTEDLPSDSLATLAVTANDAWLVQTPFIDLQPLPNGMGDVFSSVLLGHLIQGNTAPVAVSSAVSTLYALVQRTQSGERDLPLVACRDQIINPSEQFSAKAAQS